MKLFVVVILAVLDTIASSELIKQTWNTSGQILPWESYLQLGEVNRPFGLELNRSSLAHHHFAIGHLCLHSFMYDTAQDAFNLALSIEPTFIEAHVGKILGCKHPLWGEIDLTCGLTSYNEAILATSNFSYSPLQLDLLSLAYLWYSNTSSIASGENAFLSSITNFSQTHPNETDIQALYGLSLLNVAMQTTFQSQSEPETMRKARDILKDALKAEPSHPGILHYLIHAYDVAQVSVAAQGSAYAFSYNQVAETASHAQHMASHIWTRIGSWSYGLKSDTTAIRVSSGMCATRILGSIQHINSTELNLVLSLMNNTNQTIALLQCDAVNRGHSYYWLTYTRMQVGDLVGSQSLVNDLFIAHNRSLPNNNRYLTYAYLARVFILVDLFYWIPYSTQFARIAQEVYMYDSWQPMIMLGNDTTDWFASWAEAAYRLGDSLRIMSTTNRSNELSTIDNHLRRLQVLVNQTIPLNQYVSVSISLMISHIRGIRYFVNGSFEACLTELENATRREATLVPDDNSPNIIFLRSFELFALHLSLIYKQRQISKDQHNEPSTAFPSDRMFSVNEYPTMALSYYQNASLLAPNRTINILGLARTNEQLGRYTEARRFYQILSDRMLSANITDNFIIQEINTFVSKYPISPTAASERRSSNFVLLFFFSSSLFIFHQYFD